MDTKDFEELFQKWQNSIGAPTTKRFTSDQSTRSIGDSLHMKKKKKKKKNNQTIHSAPMLAIFEDFWKIIDASTCN